MQLSFYNPGQFFGPEMMLDVYRNVPCMTPDGPVTFAVTNYRNSNHTKKEPNQTDADCTGTADAFKIAGYLETVARDFSQRAGGNQAFVECFLGKGSPQALSNVMQIFVDYAERFVARARRDRAQGVIAQCAAILDDSTITWQETLQQIADKWIGLDCCGFVGNWLKLVAPEFKLDQDVHTRNVLPIARAVRTYETIEYWDLMCYAANDHIAVISDVTDYGNGSRSFDVCQSAGVGPCLETHNFVEAGRDFQGRPLFRLATPSAADVAAPFYVLSLW